MMFSRKPFSMERTGGEAPEYIKDIEMAYHIPTDWGVLQVSEAANEAYGLVPLVGGVEQGESASLDVSEREIPLVRVNLLGPDESVLPPQAIPEISGIPEAQQGFGLGISTALSEGLFEVTANFSTPGNRTAEEMLGDLKHTIEEDLPYELDEDELPLGPNGENLREYFSQQVPQLYAHLFSQAVGEAVSDRTEEYLRMLNANNLYRKISHTTALGTGYFGLVAALSFGEGGITPGLAVSSAVMATVLGMDIRRDIRSYLRHQEGTSHLLQQAGNFTGYTVSSSIHEAFCSAHFDRTIEQTLGLDAEE